MSNEIKELTFPKSRGVDIGQFAIERDSWYDSQPDGPIISGKTFLDYKSDDTYIEEYTIPYGIESIAEYAFSGLSSLKKINIPDTVKYIGSGAFSYTGISEVVIPEGVKKISNYLFSGCTNLSKVTIPDSVTYIGYSAFEGCKNISGEFIIPENVTYIGGYAFVDTNITNFKFQRDDKITYIGERAFCYTPWYNAQPDGDLYIEDVFLEIKSPSSDETPTVESVNIKDGTRVIACGALCGYEGSITVPDSIEYINDEAFSYSSATNDVITKNVVEIGAFAFAECHNITELNIPKSLKVIDDYAFAECCNLTTVSETANLISIGHYAFSSTKVTKFSIGSALESFGKYVFEDNTGLEKFTVKSDNKNFSVKNGVLYNKEQSIIVCYPNAKKDSTFVITNDIVCFDGAFGGSEYLTEIIIDEGIYSIPKNVFHLMYSVEEVTIPTTVKKIGKTIFPHDSNLKIVNYNAENSYSYLAFKWCENLTTVNIGEKVTSISESSFVGCSKLVNVNFAGNVEFIGQEAFAGSEWEENIRNCAEGEIVYVDKVLYFGGKASGDVVVKNGTKSIYYEAFDNHTDSDSCSYDKIDITSILLPDSLENIGAGAFKKCTEITSMTIPSGVKEIQEYTFMYCYSLENVILNEGLQSISGNAFDECVRLEDIFIPASVENIATSAFSECITIRGYKNTAAQYFVERLDYIDYVNIYGENIHHTFVEIEKMMGDINDDGIVNVTDVTVLQKYLAGMSELTNLQLVSCDVTDNAKIDIKDASYIAKSLAGFCEI